MNAIQYKFPQDSWQTILLLAFFLYVDQASVGTLGSRIRNAVGGARTLDILRKLTVSVHIAEALAMLVVNIKRGSSPLVGVRWSVANVSSSGSSPPLLSASRRGFRSVVRLLYSADSSGQQRHLVNLIDSNASLSVQNKRSAVVLPTQAQNGGKQKFDKNEIRTHAGRTQWLTDEIVVRLAGHRLNHSAILPNFPPRWSGCRYISIERTT